MHLGHLPAKHALVGAAAERQEVHDDVGAVAALAIAKVQHLGNADRVGGMHGAQTDGFTVEHLLAVLVRCLDEELALCSGDSAEGRPARAAHPLALADSTVALLDPLLRVGLRTGGRHSDAGTPRDRQQQREVTAQNGEHGGGRESAAVSAAGEYIVT